MLRMLLIFIAIMVPALLGGCTFNFDVTSQRTALENQVMGSYRELDDDLILASSVRGVDSQKHEVSPSKQQAVDARLNQQFNKDDIEEFKDKELVGEASDGTLAILPKSLGKVQNALRMQIELVQQILIEENRDRGQIWQRIITSNPNLSPSDLPEVRNTYAKMQREVVGPGQWYQDETRRWTRKPITTEPGA